MNLRLLALGLITMLLPACGTPVLHTAAPVGTTVRDDGLVGEWATSDTADDLQIRVIITGPKAPTSDLYPASLSVFHKNRLSSAISLDVHITDIGEHRYADLFLAENERSHLAGMYGFLVVPVHQIVRIKREGDSLDLWMFDKSWSDGEAGLAQRASINIGDRDVVLFTSTSDNVRAILAQVGQGDEAFGERIRLIRLR